VVQGELADGLGVDLDEPPEVRVLVAEPLYDLFNIRTFATMLTQLIGQNLPQWISDVRAAELPGMSF
jgi:hypothetical protein